MAEHRDCCAHQHHAYASTVYWITSSRRASQGNRSIAIAPTYPTRPPCFRERFVYNWMAKGCMQFVHLIESFEVISSLATLKRSDAEQRGQLAWKTFSPAAAAPPALLPVPAPPPAPLPVGGGPLGGGGSTLNLAAHAGHAKAVGTVGTTTRSWLVHEGHWTRHVGGGGAAGGARGSAEPRGAGNLASSSSSDLPEANRRHQRPSEVIGKSSEVIRGHQRPSEVIGKSSSGLELVERLTHAPKLFEALKGQLRGN